MWPLITTLLLLYMLEVGAGAHAWTDWSAWSECSRTCDGGAAYQLRRCAGTQRCEGDNIRYKTCNRTPCPVGSVDFRAQQCSAYNDVRYEARLYEWVPMPEPRDPCSLRCRAAQHAFSVMLAPKVLDGTRCDTTTIDICINGTCRKVGCDGLLGSALAEDRCGVCGGDSSSCGVRRGSHIRPAASQFRWVETEAGPCSVTCGVGLAKTSVVCKDRRNMQVVYNTYCSRLRKPRPAHRECAAPACQPVWITGEWQACSKSCGGGTSRRNVYCVQEHKNGSFRNRFSHLCIHPRPSISRSCNHHVCPKWYAGSWSPCSVTCAKGVQHREVICRRTQHQGCRLSDRPSTRRTCDTYVTCMGQKAEAQGNSSASSQAGRERELVWKSKPGGGMDAVEINTSVREDELLNRLPLASDELANNLLNQIKAVNATASLVPTEHVATTIVAPPREQTPHHSSVAPPGASVGKQTLVTAVPRQIKVKILQEKPDDLGASHYVQPEAQQETYFLHASGRKTSFLEPYLEGRMGQVKVTGAGGGQSPRGKGGSDGSGGRADDEVLTPDGDLENARPGDAAQNALNGGVSTVPRFISSPWGVCSATCGFGIRTRAVTCKVYLKFSETVQDLPDGDCTGMKPREVEQCHLLDCPQTSEAPSGPGKAYRWRHNSYSDCDVSCLGGFQAPTYMCIELVTALKVEPGLCKGLAKPLVDRIKCNDIPCPPRWRMEQFRPCSALCGGGHRRRRVECVHDLAHGADKVAVLNDTLCPLPVPRRSILCNLLDCPPSWVVTGDWSQCSMTCGEGIRTRPVLCQQVVHPGRTQNASDPSACPANRPEARQPCYNDACPQAATNAGHVTIGSDPTKYVMLAKSRRVQLVVGGEAVLLPGVNVVVRCPAKHYNRKLVYWRKNDELLPRRGRIKVSRHGALHMKRTSAKDTGTYTCVVDASSSNISVSFQTPQEAERLLQGRLAYLRYNYRELLTQRRADSNRVVPREKGERLLPGGGAGGRFHELLSTLSRNVSGLPYVYLSGQWSACSQSCGFRGLRWRNVTCEVITETYIRVVENGLCRRQGLAEPLASQDCGMHACPHWEIGPWTRCSGRKCSRTGVGTSTRVLYCVLQNGTTTDHDVCGDVTRPKGVRECRHDACAAQWRPSSWSKCSRSCGGLGMKRRTLTCVWTNNEGPAGRHCRGLTRPPTDKACTAPDCTHVACIDKSSTCSMIPRLKLCHVWYGECCWSCHARVGRRARHIGV